MFNNLPKDIEYLIYDYIKPIEKMNLVIDDLKFRHSMFFFHYNELSYAKHYFKVFNLCQYTSFMCALPIKYNY